MPEGRPRTGEMHPCLLTSDPGKGRSRSNNDDWLRWQINLFEPAKVFSKIERWCFAVAKTHFS